MKEKVNKINKEVNLIAYTDGACSRNPGIGGYSVVIIQEGSENPILEVSGGKFDTTNNYMELKAITRAMKHLLEYPWYSNDYGSKCSTKKLSKATIKSDSAYCINAINQGWVYTWKQKGWKTKEYKQVKNKDLWEELLYYLSKATFQLTFEKVKGHSGDRFNELADTLAKEQVNRLKAKNKA